MRSLVYVLLSVILFTICISCTNSNHSVSIIYPFENSVFPSDFAPPSVRWNDDSITKEWNIEILIENNKLSSDKTTSCIWYPSLELWNKIKSESKDKLITIKVSAIDAEKIVAYDEVVISISNDSVGAPIFFRSVILPFSHANKYKDSLQWYLGNVGNNLSPKLLMSGIPVCANCHSFSADGTKFAMDVDYANNKGSYTISKLESESAIKIDNIITWDDYLKDEKESTFGLLSQLSPDGKWAVSTVKDRSVFVPVDDNFAYSQLFFPLKGILALYNTETKAFTSLKGADNQLYVQSSPAWSPDGTQIAFAKAKRDQDSDIDTLKTTILDRSFANDYIGGTKGFQYDLWTVPFNNGKGGESVALKGASENGKSNYFPKYSPDGKWIVFCQADNFMLLRKDSKLYIIPAEGGQARKMNCNSDDMNSWHSWSPNGKWLVYSTKKFGSYTQLFLTHIDENGNDSPPVWLEYFDLPKRAINIPEFVNTKYSKWNKISDAFSSEGNYYTRSIEEALKSRDYKNALYYANMILKIEPENADIYMKRAGIYMDMKEKEKAFADFEKVISLADIELSKNPKSLKHLKQKALVYSQSGRYQQAISLLEKIQQFDSDNFENFKMKLAIMIDARMIKEVLNECNSYLKNNPENIEIRSLRADIYLQLRDFASALVDLNLLIKINNNDLMLRIKRLNVNYMLRRADDCLKDAAILMNNGTYNIMPYYISAEIYFAKKNYAEAKKSIQSAEKIISARSFSNPVSDNEKGKVAKLSQLINSK